MADYSKCLLQDGSYFIGYTSLPFGDETTRVIELQSFFDNKREKLYEKTTTLKQNSKNEAETAENLDKYFYKPKYYYLFGGLDLAAVCLVEGFNLPVRQYNYFGIQENGGDKKKGFEISFSKHNLLGPTPRFSHSSDIVDLYKSLDEKQSDFPLIGIIRIKINDLFLFDYGVEFIRAYLKSVRILFNRDKSRAKDFTFLILESYGWSEISIVVFCNNYQLIHSLIPEIRGISKSKMIEILNSSEQKADKELAAIISETWKASETINDKDPICLDTYTVLGFDYDIIEPVNKKVDNYWATKAKVSLEKLSKIKNDDFISPILECSLQPGQFHSTIDELKRVRTDFFDSGAEYQSLAGKSDLLIQFPPNKTISTKNFIRSIRKMAYMLDLEKLFVKFSTTLSFPPKFRVKNLGDSTFTAITEKSKHLIFKSNELSKMKYLLRRNNVSHVEQEAFLNFFAVYNNNISNPLSFGEFLELRPFLSYMQNVVESSVSKVPFEKLDLDGPLKTLNHAYRNRSLDSYDNKDRYDYFTFLTIGAQSLVSSFDILYKSFTSVLGNRGSFIFVEADHEFTTSNYALRLNYFHLFNPEILCSVLIQEVCNQCSFRFGKDNPDVFIFHRKFDSDKSGTELIKQCLTVNGINFSHPKPEFEKLIKGLNAEIFEHIFADVLGVKIFYEDNLDRYLFWSWAYFSTDSDHYHFQSKESSGANILEDRFILFLLRQLIVLKIWNPEKYSSYEASFDPMISELSAKHLSFLKKFIDKYLFRGEIKIWLDIVKKFSIEVSNQLLKEDIDFSKLKMKEKLLAGEVCIYPKNLNKLKSFLYSKNLILSFLEAVEDKGFSLNQHKHRILRRNPSPEENFDYNGVLFDPLGGPYIINPIFRRDLFKIRSAFHMSLSDMALKTKGKLLMENIPE